MTRSTFCFLMAPVIGGPSWVVDVNALPHNIQIAWLAALVVVALLGGMFWYVDGK